MKKIFIAFLSFVLLAGNADAQQTKEKIKQKGERQGWMMDKGLDSLNLTADQKNRISALNQSFRQAMSSLRSETLTDDQMKTRREALQKQHVEDIHAILTTEQKLRFDAMNADNEKRKGKSKYKSKSKTDNS